MTSFRGQVLPANTLRNTVEVELIHEGVKYKAVVVKNGPNTYFLVMNGSSKEVEVHRMSDGGKLKQMRIYLFIYLRYNFAMKPNNYLRIVDVR